MQLGYVILSKEKYDALPAQCRKDMISISNYSNASELKITYLDPEGANTEHYVFKFDKDRAVNTVFSGYQWRDQSEMRSIIKAGVYTEDDNTTTYDRDGVPLSQTKIVPAGHSFHAPSFLFKTSTAGSLRFLNKFGTDIAANEIVPGFKMCSLEFFQSEADYNTMTTCAANLATMSIVKFTPPYNYYVVSGGLRQISQPAEDVRVYAMLGPYISYAQGGSREFICCSNLRFRANESVHEDGKAPKFVPHIQVSSTPIIFSNTIEVVLTHSAGFAHEVEIEIGLFRE